MSPRSLLSRLYRRKLGVRPARPRLGFESLEDRALLNGTIIAEPISLTGSIAVVGGQLQVHSSDLHDVIRLDQAVSDEWWAPATRVRVYGLNYNLRKDTDGNPLDRTYKHS